MIPYIYLCAHRTSVTLWIIIMHREVTVYITENTKHQRRICGWCQEIDLSLENQLKEKVVKTQQTVDFSFSNVKENGKNKLFFLIGLKWHYLDPSIFSQLKIFFPLSPFILSVLSCSHWGCSTSFSNLYSLI